LFINNSFIDTFIIFTAYYFGMKVFQGADIPVLNAPVVTIGFFDGVHLGHCSIIAQLIETARLKGTDHLLITMWPHPTTLVRKKNDDSFLLSTLDEKLLLIEKLGVENVLVLSFDKETADYNADEFIAKILVEKLKVTTLLMGFNNTFGKGGKPVTAIAKIAEAYNIEFIVAHEYQSTVPISSSTIREKLSKGNIPEANNILGYQYSFEGIVVSGYKIGRTLGFKTANVKPCFDEKILPGNGVYAVEIIVDSTNYYGVMNIGYRPTFDGKERSIEVHIFDFESDIYGDIITIRLHKKLRNEIRFSNADALIAQLNRDKRIAAKYFALRRQ